MADELQTDEEVDVTFDKMFDEAQKIVRYIYEDSEIDPGLLAGLLIAFLEPSEQEYEIDSMLQRLEDLHPHYHQGQQRSFIKHRKKHRTH